MQTLTQPMPQAPSAPHVETLPSDPAWSPGGDPPPVPPGLSRGGLGVAEVVIALVAFGILCAVVLSHATALLEPDDYAYRASIVALSQGHLTLSSAQYASLARQLNASGGIQQWHHLADGRWISEKNPGYPFLAVPFYVVGLLRAAPLFYGAIGCLGLFAGARRWLGRWGGTWAVGLYCTSAVAMVFAWRDTMPTFTETSLLAAGMGGLLWAVLATDGRRWWRTAVGLGAFVALELAVFVRYTDVVVLVIAVAAVLACRWSKAFSLPQRALWWWVGSAALFGTGVLTFNALVYGKALSTGYSPGEITFGLGAIPGNLAHMPFHLVASMPVLWLGLLAVGWMVVHYVALRRRHDPAPSPERRAAGRDVAVGATLAAAWLGIWGLYAMYYWTAQMSVGTGGTVHVVRFFVPALGALALLGAWALVRVPRPLAIGGLVLLLVAGLWSFNVMRSAGGAPGGGAGIGGKPGAGVGGPSFGPGGGAGGGG